MRSVEPVGSTLPGGQPAPLASAGHRGSKIGADSAPAGAVLANCFLDETQFVEPMWRVTVLGMSRRPEVH